MRFPITIKRADLLKHEGAFKAALRCKKPDQYRDSEWACVLGSAHRVTEAIFGATGEEITLSAFDWGTLEHLLGQAFKQRRTEKTAAAYQLLYHILRNDPKYKAIQERISQEETARRQVEKLEAQLSEAKGKLQDVVHENRMKERTEE